MRAIVHFSVGVSGMMLLLSFINLNNKKEFLLIFISGFWAMVPDLGWLLLRIGMPGIAGFWKTVFNSPIGLLFWFSPFLDGLEPVNRVFEMVSAFMIMATGIIFYYLVNNWNNSVPDG